MLKMSVSVILAHPNTDSFNHAIASAAVETLNQNGHDTCFHDLYQEQFGPILLADEIPAEAHLPPEIQKHCDEISQTEGVIVIHPNWWGQPPAILKGWIDRVMRPGVAYEFMEGDTGEGVPRGLLKARAAIVFNTSNTETEREKKTFGDPLENIWERCIFDLCGVDRFYRKMFNIIVVSSEDQRKIWLNEVRKTVAEYFPRYL